MLIDTPGFDDTTRAPSEVLEEISKTLTLQYESGMKLKGVIYLHRISDIRYSGSAIQTFEIFRKVCGDKALKNVFLVTNRWDQVSAATGAQREHQLREEFWTYMLNRGSRMSRFHGTRDSAVAVVSQLMSQPPTVLALQREISDQGKPLDQTAAGAFVNDGLTKTKKHVEEEVASLQKLQNELDQMQADLQEREDVVDDLKKKMHRLRVTERHKARLHQDVAGELRQKARDYEKQSTFKKLLGFVPTLVSIVGLVIGIEVPDGSW